MYRKRRTEDEWQTLFEAQAISTLSPPAFCKQNNIHLKTFYARRSSISRQGPAIKGKLVKVIKDKRVSQPVASTDVTLRFKGVEINCQHTINPSWVASLIKELLG
jgi:hypothetical protein